MSDERITIEQKIAGEVWWMITIAAHTLPEPYWSSGGVGRWSATQMPDYDTAINKTLAPIDIWNEPIDRSLWIVLIEGDGVTTNIQIVAPADQEQRWKDWLGKIGRFAAMALEQQRSLRKVTADDVIDEYYFLKHIGRKKTLKQLAEQYDFSENYLYQAKSKYDEAGKFGRNLRQAYKVSRKP